MSPHHLGSLVFLHWKYLNIWDLSVLKIGVGHIPCMLDVGYFSPRSTYMSGVLRTENPHVLRASFARTRLTAADVFFGWRAGFCDASVRYLIVQVPRKSTDTSWNLKINQGGKEIHCSKLHFWFHASVGDCSLNTQVPASCTVLPFGHQFFWSGWQANASNT